MEKAILMEQTAKQIRSMPTGFETGEAAQIIFEALARCF